VNAAEARLYSMSRLAGSASKAISPRPFVSIADERLLEFCATCGVTFIERNSLTKSSAS
jgi:hypothetical protein